MRSAAGTVARTFTLAFVLVATLFFVWGFATATVDTLIPAVKSIFRLSYREAMLTQFAFFIAYAVVSLPAAAVLARIGYARTVVVALAAMILGCLTMSVATRGASFAGVLGALFVVASGVTMLQVAANPLVAALGTPDRSHFRLTLVQAFNSLGTIVAPYVGAMFILRGGVFDTVRRIDASAASLARIEVLFLGLAGAIVLIGIAIWSLRDPIDRAGTRSVDERARSTSPLAAFRDRWSVAGAGAIFLYVGSEVAILSLMINFLAQPSVLGWSHEAAGKMLALYGVGRMSGRFVGSWIMTKVPVDRLLTITTLTAASMCLLVAITSGGLAAALALTIGLFTSITFPAVFTLTLERSRAPAAASSGLLVMAITGGAIVPLAAGWLADKAGLGATFALPAVGFLGVASFAFAAVRARGRAAA